MRQRPARMGDGKGQDQHGGGPLGQPAQASGKPEGGEDVQHQKDEAKGQELSLQRPDRPRLKPVDGDACGPDGGGQFRLCPMTFSATRRSAPA